MNMVTRTIQGRLEKALFKGKIVILYGARQVGKTTLVKALLKQFASEAVYLNCDEPDIRKAFEETSSTEMLSFIGGKKLVILDEAQRVKNIGLSLKLLIDTAPELQIIATGSSSFDLSNKISEPLTGRKEEFFLAPFSLEEFGQLYSKTETDRLLEGRILYGMYPEIVLTDQESVEKRLLSLAQSYAYKDILQYEGIRNAEALEKILAALALQIGSEVSYTELASFVGVNKKTVESYIRILEQAFIIFRLNPFGRNLRTELKKLRKVYFFDTGLRNALIRNFNPLSLRQDRGALWENFLIAERVKANLYLPSNAQSYFWRTHQKQEIDYLEENDGILSAFEIKWSKEQWRAPKVFTDTYPTASTTLINRKNYREFLTL